MMRLAFLPLTIGLLWPAFSANPVAASSATTDAASAPAAYQATDAKEEKEEADEKQAEEKKSNDADDSSKKSDKATAKDEPAAEKTSTQDDGKPATEKTGAKDKPPTDESANDKPAAKSEEKTADKPETKKRKTLKLEPQRLKIDIALDGTFVARNMHEVPLRPEAWATFEIAEVVPHGEKVHKGQTLIKFDDEKINEAIEDLELEQRLNELAILRAEEEMPRLEKTLKLDFAAADRSSIQAKEDFERYNEIDRPMAVKSAEFLVKYYNFMLNYEKDELEQLEKMYEADDLTEETEEIVLKRQKNAVEIAEFSLENARQNRDEVLQVRLPRYDIRVKEALERTALARARAQMALSIDLNRARYELEQRKEARAKSLDKHAELTEDRGLMEIESPADGIVYYGHCVNGRWSDTPTLINKYKPHGKVSPGSILMTIVDPRPLYVSSQLEEAKRPDVRDGQEVKIALPAEGNERIAGDVKSISPIPVSPGKFEINFDLEQDAIPEWITPGMSCKVQINVYDKKDALVVPKTAIHDDEENEDQKFVWLVDPDDDEAKPERRNVKLGRRKGNEVEIVKGLKEGDVISLEDESKKKDKTVS